MENNVNSATTNTELSDLRQRLPRLADLHARFRSASRENFFRDFEKWFNRSGVTYRYYKQIELDLSFVPEAYWDAFASKVGAVVNYYDKKHHREWEKLFDVFNEAIGARVLKQRFGCSEVHLSPTGKGETCDWFGVASCHEHYLEVKTLNHSDVERRSWYGEAKLVHTTLVPAALIRKAKSSYQKAKGQLDAMPRASTARKIVLFVVNADHNFDPFDGNVSDLLLQEFDKFEVPGYSIQLAVNSPNG